MICDQFCMLGPFGPQCFQVLLLTGFLSKCSICNWKWRPEDPDAHVLMTISPFKFLVSICFINPSVWMLGVHLLTVVIGIFLMIPYHGENFLCH